MPNPKFFKLNDIKKHSLTKNNSLLDIFPKIKNTLDMNNSFDNKNNINSLKNAITINNRFKSFGKIKIILNNYLMLKD